MNDRHVINMAMELKDVPLAMLANENNEPTFDFMLSANKEYDKRGGGDQRLHLGAVAQAVIRILAFLDTPGAVWPAKPSPAFISPIN